MEMYHPAYHEGINTWLLNKDVQYTSATPPMLNSSTKDWLTKKIKSSLFQLFLHQLSAVSFYAVVY